MTNITSLKVGALAATLLAGVSVSAQEVRTLPTHVIKMTPSAVKPCPLGIATPNNASVLKPLTTQQKIELQHRINNALSGQHSTASARVFKSAPKKADAKWGTLVEENFEYMTDGNDSVPGAGISDNSTWEIPDKYFHTPGWTGEGVYQAGGAVALAYPGFGGVLNTPLGKYKGHLKISFRVKSIAKKSHIASIVLCRGGIEDPTQAGDNYEWATFKTADGWQTFEMETTNYYDQDDCFLQINAGTYDDGIIVDDLRIEENQSFVGVPQKPTVGHFTHDGFTASWKAVDNADKYLINLYRLQDKAVGSTEQITDFDDLGLDADGNFTNIPEGWTFKLKKDSIATGYDGTTGVAFCGDSIGGDPGYIQTEGTGGVIKSLSFYITKLSENSELMTEYGYSTAFSLKGYTGKYWEEICEIALDDFTIGEPQQITSELLKQYDVDITSQKYSRLRFCAGINDYGSFVLDQVELTTEIPQDTTLYQKDVAATATSYDFTGLDMDRDYYYDVRAVREGVGESEPTDMVHAFGVAAPVATAATDIDERGEFTANWEAEPNANCGYAVCLNKTYVAPEAVKDYEILSEDFSKVTTSATVDDPESYGNRNYVAQLDDVTKTTGWYGQGNIMANGMFGCRQGDEPIFEIITPELPLGNGDGTYKVALTAYFVTADTLVIQGGDDYDLAYIPGKAGETVTTTVTMKNGQDDMRVWFYTDKYGSFFLDDVKITQDLNKGDKIVYSNIEQEQTEDTKYTFTGLDVTPGTSYSYVVYALRSLYDEEAVSDASNEVAVDVLTGIKSVAADKADATKRIYDLNGRELSTAKHGVYIVRENGTTRKVVK